MIIGLSGAQGVGKTTLLNRLKTNEILSHYKFNSEVTRWVKSLGLKINEAGDDETQLVIAMAHTFNLVSSSANMITDRTILDCLVYTRYLHENKKVSTETLEKIESAFDRIQNGYDVLFYISPEFDIEDDGVRSTSSKFRDRIVQLFEETLIEFRGKVIRLSGTPKEREDIILNWVLGECVNG